MGVWFQHNPDRLDAELEALKASGLEYQVSQDAMNEDRLEIHVTVNVEDVSHTLIAYYPDTYPYFPFMVIAPTLDLESHQSPYDKLLCLVADIQNKWDCEGDNLAKYIVEQFPVLLQANSGTVLKNGEEAKEGAPVTGQVQYMPFQNLLVEHFEIPNDCDRGSLEIGLDRRTDPAKVELRGAVLEVRGTDGTLVAKLNSVLSGRYKTKISARWVKLDSHPATDQGEDVLHEAIEKWPDLEKPIWKRGVDIIGLYIPEEVDYRIHKYNWIFVVRTNKKNSKHPIYLARAAWAGRDNIAVRAHTLTPIHNKKICQVGVGALGATTAFQLARAGAGSLSLLDHDIVEAGNLLRWMPAWPYLTRYKIEAIYNMISANYPYTEVNGYVHKIGVAARKDTISDNQVIPKMFDGANLILDCTAEMAVSNYLSDLAKSMGIPYVWATATPGARGGVIGRQVPGNTQGCWRCYQAHMADGTIMLPAQEPDGDVHPIGCFSPTFMGSGFDLDMISIQAVRLVISTLCDGIEGGYPSFDWDIGVMSQWDDETPIPPQWKTYSLSEHPDCNHG